MKFLNKYANHIPYLYFIAIVAYWFTNVNRSEGLTAYPILLFGIPFLWQLIKPNKQLNFTLGITFVCLSSYLILGYFSNLLNVPSIQIAKGVIIYSGFVVLLNFLMSLWIIRNSLKQTF
ncbi:hypothetical protein [Pontimicrobium sp. IMCC45349]|jgi:hypothetical protein|uniref:hypothetical protein n=1 Tax=Pontimicrobium sp. IMCC45349 TaxID=3391574 RepID=UPI0039A1BEE8